MKNKLERTNKIQLKSSYGTLMPYTSWFKPAFLVSQGSATLHPGLTSIATPWLGSIAKA